MKSKERVMMAMQHKEPDRVPFMYRDIPSVRHRLLMDLQLKDDEELFEFLGIDFRWIEPRRLGCRGRNRIHAKKHDASEEGKIRSIFGVDYLYRKGIGGGYWEPEVFPLKHIEDPVELEDYPWPNADSFDFSVLDEQIRKAEDYALMSAPNIYCSPGVLTVIQDLFGMEKTLTDMYINPELWHKTAEKIMEFNRDFLEKFFRACSSSLDFFRIGEDYGTQRGLLFSPDQYNEFLAPHNRSMYALAKKNGMYAYQHTCGSVRQLIPDLLNVGIDVLDPIQVLTEGMEPGGLKRDFGDVLCFSGGIDEQHLLPMGSPQDVKDEVSRILEIMAPSGGFFLGPTHNFQEDIPTDNIIAMYEAAKEFFR